MHRIHSAHVTGKFCRSAFELTVHFGSNTIPWKDHLLNPSLWQSSITWDGSCYLRWQKQLFENLWNCTACMQISTHTHLTFLRFQVVFLTFLLGISLFLILEAILKTQRQTNRHMHQTELQKLEAIGLFFKKNMVLYLPGMEAIQPREFFFSQNFSLKTK